MRWGVPCAQRVRVATGKSPCPNLSTPADTSSQQQEPSYAIPPPIAYASRMRRKQPSAYRLSGSSSRTHPLCVQYVHSPGRCSLPVPQIQRGCASIWTVALLPIAGSSLALHCAIVLHLVSLSSLRGVSPSAWKSTASLPEPSLLETKRPRTGGRRVETKVERSMQVPLVADSSMLHCLCPTMHTVTRNRRAVGRQTTLPHDCQCPSPSLYCAPGFVLRTCLGGPQPSASQSALSITPIWGRKELR
ncbi:hypothetical protein C8T65DRAFT_667469 [Cerioporus squamosus]|nr:hypothetical protein C8T65DRAFT_667469 [Cerioporus squamosus]